MSGITSPARPWFRLTTPDPSYAESPAIKDWLYLVGERMSGVFLKSNLYNILPIIYGDITVFATSAMMVEEDFDNVMHFYAFPIGSYAIATNDKGRVDVFMREFRMTVRQLVRRFGQKDRSGKMDWSNFSTQVRSLYEGGQMEAWIDVYHIIQPNEEFDEYKVESKHKKYSSCYYEKGASGGKGGTYASGANDEDKALRESGYDYFPVLCPRWEVTGEDVYGTECPGMVALGDIRALQVMQKKKAQAIEKMVNPPMVGPTSMKNSKASLLPGDLTYADVREGQQGFRPIHEVNPRVNELVMDIQEYQSRIQRAFYEDLFLMLSNSDRRQITAREIDVRQEEKLLALGPVLEQLNQDLLDPLIDIAYIVMDRQGLIPPPPEEIQGMQLKVEYISIMAQAQKLAGISGIERFSGFVSSVAAYDPSVLMKVDAAQMIDVYGDRLSLQPGIVRSDEDVAAMQAQQQKAAEAQRAVEAIGQGAAAVKNLAGANLEEDNALTRLISNANAGSMIPQ